MALKLEGIFSQYMAYIIKNKGKLSVFYNNLFMLLFDKYDLFVVLRFEYIFGFGWGKSLTVVSDEYKQG